MITMLKENSELNTDCLAINPAVLKFYNYPLNFNNFKELLSNDITKLDCVSNVVQEDTEMLFDYLISPEILKLFENKDKNSSKKYDFRVLYEISDYYSNPIAHNRFIIEQLAKQDKYLFPHISEEVANDNEFMYTLLCEHKAKFNLKDNPGQALYSKIEDFGSIKKYVKMLKLKHDLLELSSTVINKSSRKTMKI